MSDENDEDLWGYITRGVKPIRREKPLDSGAGKALKKPEKAPPVPGSGKTRPVITALQQEKGGEEAGGHGLDRRSAEKLRKGLMPIEARLDLHGMTQAQAHEALQRFILSSQTAGKRCVLVITGKGNDAQGRRDPLSKGQGVLKRMVPEWLAQPPLRALVLKTSSARPQHGGGGALYVLLRRQRG